MQKIIPHLWYDTQAREAALFYAGLFEDARLLNTLALHGTPSGDAEVVDFELAGQGFKAISAGPYFTFTPAISLMVTCRSAEEVEAKWQALSEGGRALMPLGEYPFSKRYGWVQDRYGLSWQLMLGQDGQTGQTGQKITPNLLFSNEVCGRAEEAVGFYAGVFPDSAVGFISRYGPGEAASPKARVNYAALRLCGQDFSAMDNGAKAGFDFNEAFSFIVACRDQEEIDYYWDKLTAVPEAEQCGWLKDKFGVSWQIVPACMDEMMASGDPAQVQRVTEAFLKMKKFDLQALQKAYEGV